MNTDFGSRGLMFMALIEHALEIPDNGMARPLHSLLKLACIEVDSSHSGALS